MKNERRRENVLQMQWKCNRFSRLCQNVPTSHFSAMLKIAHLSSRMLTTQLYHHKNSLFNIFGKSLKFRHLSSGLLTFVINSLKKLFLT